MSRSLRRFATSALALMLVTLAGCAATPRHEFDQQANFSELQSFAWLEPEYGKQGVGISDPVLDSPLLGQRVENAVKSVLQERGYRLAEENPDFLVTYHTAVGEKERRSGSYMSLGYGRGHSPFFGTGILLDMTPRSFKEGTLIVDVVDAETEELIWRGWNDTILNQRNFDQQRVNETVRFILGAFPPERR